MIFIQIIIGAIFRRCWGGWHVPTHWAKVVMAFALAFIVGAMHTHDLISSLIFSVAIGLAFLNTFHGEGMGMGFTDHDKELGRKTWHCFLIMGGSYGFYTLGAALLIWLWSGQFYYAFAFNGFLTPIPYYFAWKYKDKIPTINVFGEPFIDEPTTVGECFLGSLLMG